MKVKGWLGLGGGHGAAQPPQVDSSLCRRPLKKLILSIAI